MFKFSNTKNKLYAAILYLLNFMNVSAVKGQANSWLAKLKVRKDQSFTNIAFIPQCKYDRWQYRALKIE